MSTNIVLVTGASRGIGAATAKQLTQAGFGVVINYHSQHDAAQAVADEITDQQGQCWLCQADVSLEADVEKLFTFIDELPGKLVALVNNAGKLQPQQKLIDMTSERVARTLQANLMSQFYCCREAIKRMSTDKGGLGGSIVNVSSLAARLGAPNEYIDYAMSKGAVDSLTKGLAVEAAPHGIRVNGVRPGFIDTDMHADGGEPDRLQRVTPNLPIPRGGTSEEVANAICWLISDQASYTTGSFIEVAGGR